MIFISFLIKSNSKSGTQNRKINHSSSNRNFNSYSTGKSWSWSGSLSYNKCWSESCTK